MEVSVAAALVAGLVSFLSPCVLPLVPGYISMLSGIGVDELRQGQHPRGSLLGSALAFITGFSVVFIAFGASASAVGQFLLHNRNSLAPLAGAVIVLFGLHLVGWLERISTRAGLIVGAALLAGAMALELRPAWLHLPLGPLQVVSISLIFLGGPFLGRWLNRDLHLRNVGGRAGEQGARSRFQNMTSGFLLGFAFAFGWTPCIGPILAAVLTLAATSESVVRGVFLLAIYSAGLAIPFLLTALGIRRFLRFYQRFRRHLHAVEVASGFLLLFVGALIYVNRLTWLSGKLGFLNRFAW